LIIVAVDFLNFLCVTEVLARSLLAMPAAAGLFWRAGRREIQNHMMLCCVAYSSLLPTTKKMDVSVVIWECLFDAKAKN
jgi:hypothetical protein